MPKRDTTTGRTGDLAHSSRIAEGLLAVLAECGHAAARTRALRALESQASLVHGSGGWLGVDRLAAMLRAADVDARLARRVGQALVRPHGVGLALCYGGLATTEKAFRRSDHLLARESVHCRYEPLEIDSGHGRVRFHPPPPGQPARLPEEPGRLVCEVRRGMLEAIPMQYGLVPARVRETQCAYAGADCCEYEVTWSRSPRTGLLFGGGAGLVLSAGLVATGVAFGWPVLALGVAVPALVVLTGAAGRSVDLARQLEAVAGARRGHLALHDQLDSALAEKMDDLAKLGAMPQAPVRGPLAPRPLAEDEPTGLVPVDRRDTIVTDACDGDTDDALPAVEEAVDLRARIERAVEALRPEWPDPMQVDLDFETDVPNVRGDPEQLDFVIEQLLRNAATANGRVIADAGDDATATLSVSLRTSPDGVEVTIEDQGQGIDPELLDKVFDPFAGDGTAGRDGGLGLPVCGRIVERHGGELRVQSAGERGTRVDFVLTSSESAES